MFEDYQDGHDHGTHPWSSSHDGWSDADVAHPDTF
jgi:hypothetical protein